MERMRIIGTDGANELKTEIGESYLRLKAGKFGSPPFGEINHPHMAQFFIPQKEDYFPKPTVSKTPGVSHPALKSSF
jgi:hypothetical protein